MDWRQLYAATMRETDAKQLDLLIEKTLGAIESRLNGLPRVKGNEEEWTERREIVLAANALLSLKPARGLGLVGGPAENDGRY
jgi:hypothetical protein